MKNGKQVFLVILMILSTYPSWSIAEVAATQATLSTPQNEAAVPADSSIAPPTAPEKKPDPAEEARKKIIADLTKQYQQFTNNPIEIEISSITGKRIISVAGSVNDIKTAYRVIVLARIQPGMDGVEYYKLTVNNKPLSPDNIICVSIMIQYMLQIYPELKDVSKMPITVTSYNGLVFLDGMVNNYDSLVKAIQIAENTPNVQRVVSRLDIRRITVRMPN